MKLEAAYRLQASGDPGQIILKRLGLNGTFVHLNKGSSTYELDEEDVDEIVKKLRRQFGDFKEGASATQRIYVWEPLPALGIALYVSKHNGVICLEVYDR